MSKKTSTPAMLVLLFSLNSFWALDALAQQINLPVRCQFMRMPYKAVTPSPAVLQTIKTITATIGLTNDFEIIAGEFKRRTPLAAAFLCQGKRYVIYDKDRFHWLKSGPMDWRVFRVLVHEIGHHVNSHIFVDNKPQRRQELEADYLAGFVAGRLGASLDQAVRFTDMLSMAGSDTHPPKNKRRDEAARGWREATERKQWEQDRCQKTEWFGSTVKIRGKHCRALSLCRDGKKEPHMACRSHSGKWVLQ
ncbi:MAG: hypothetical protein ABJN40_01580 [Sneathiella sp.]